MHRRTQRAVKKYLGVEVDLPTPRGGGRPRRRPPKSGPAYEAIDHDGAKVMKVPLSDGIHEAKLWPQDYRRLAAMNMTTGWCYNAAGPGHQYVRIADSQQRFGPGELVTAARIIVDAGKGERVKYRDGNRLNLRRENLNVIPQTPRQPRQLRQKTEDHRQPNAEPAKHDD
ncbi:hypothetical protein ACERK3_13115 [Phycisphaerales bacterium AB-hyl4]|uniref:HNH endonuclease n=1 Tax=Natronomicrosphaera hydrolytica TaxID=3242702 RepID=A0ABV4U6J6_9BACT